MRAASIFLIGLSCWSTGCSSAAGVVGPSPISETAQGTTSFVVAGLVMRGPIQPVCQEGVPCEAPFSADFTVRRDDTIITTFRSDANGRFDLRLAPGTYLIIPSPNAPILFPQNQARQIVVAESDTVNLRLEFDTGMR